ncbi:MAG: methionyl-tRNA formyltransferase [Planctomycetes bacterium]|nr:methionyl-tRNA formyltransferase [Planctomycetota bacterium]
MLSNNKKIKIIFAGTPDFAVPTLRELILNPAFELVAVITQEDKPVGRKQELMSPPVKTEALKNNIKVLQPTKIKDIFKELEELSPDLIIVAAYGQILPLSILELPKFGCVNIHASLLPKYRGASCLQAAILNGDQETGITIMQMAQGLDTGDILYQEKITLDKKTTIESLHDNLAELAAKIISPILIKYVQGIIEPIPQNKAGASYVGVINKEDGKIDWQKKALEIERKIRAFNPWPGTFSYLIEPEKKRLLKIIEAGEIITTNKKPGEMFLQQNNLAVACGQDALIIKKLQIEGSKIMTSEEFLHGHNIIGQTLL